MLIMFWVGLIWREDDDAERQAPPARLAKADWRPAVALATVLALATAYQAHVVAHPMHAAQLTPPEGAGWQREASAMTSWEPHWRGMDQMLTAHYRGGERRVMLNVAWYGGQRQDAELINSQNILVPEKHPVWRQLGRKTTRHDLESGPLELVESVLDSRAENQRLLVWQWHRIQARDGISPYRAKIELTLSALLGQGTEATAVILAAPFENDPAEARAVLTAFLAAHKTALDASLDRANEP
jgi:EpsI family protein